MARPLKYPQLANLKMVGDVVVIPISSDGPLDIGVKARRYAKRKGFDVALEWVMECGVSWVRVERRS